MFDEKDLLKVNLQLFAGPEDEEQNDDEVEDEGYSGDEKTEEESEDTENGNEDQETDETDAEKDSTDDEEVEEPEKKQPKKQMDKKDHAIIKAKQESKALKAELAKYKQAEEEKKLAEQKEQLKKKYVDNGYTEEEAAERAEEKSRVAKLERKIRTMEYNSQAEKLSQRFPDIFDNLDHLVELCEKTGWPLEKVAKAELDESSEYDIKTKTEQEALLRRQKAAEKKVETGSVKTPKQTKLSPVDERTYQNMRKLPGHEKWTREDYLKILKQEE